MEKQDFIFNKNDMNWYVVYTKPKWEKKVAEKLQQIGIECYCPLVTQVKQWSDRKKKVEVPLFNSYVFVQLHEKDRNSVFQIAGIVRYLFWLGKPAIVRDEEIDIIKKNLKASNVSEISVTPMQVGDRIKLDSGAFSNQDAIVQEVSNTHYILVLESLGCVLKIKYK
jgi:transcription antitermination factor NusG